MPSSHFERASEVRSTNGLPEVLVHQIAHAMCFAKHGDHRYDPGNPKHRRWFDRAKAFASAARVGYERISNDDGRGTIPSSPDDHPETYAVRFVGGWVNERPERG